MVRIMHQFFSFLIISLETELVFPSGNTTIWRTLAFAKVLGRAKPWKQYPQTLKGNLNPCLGKYLVLRFLICCSRASPW